MTPPSITAAGPREAVVSVGWTGHRLLYLEAVLAEATRQGRAQLVIVDVRALDAPEWPRIDQMLVGHELHAVNFEKVTLKQALPFSIERVIALEADALMVEFFRILKDRPQLQASLQLMREPDADLVQGSRTLASSGAKAALIVALSTRYGLRCRIHVLRSPLFPPASLTKTLVSKGRCTTIVDPVLSPTNPVPDSDVRPDAAPPTALVTGQLNARKSIDTLLDAWPDTALRPYRLVLRGRISDDTDVHGLTAVARAKGADVVVDDQYLTDDELGRAMHEASAVLCLHRSDVPSGVAALAIQAGCPVIAFAHTQLGKALSARGLGVAIKDVDGPELAAALRTCMTLSREGIRQSAARIHEHATTQVFSQQLLYRDDRPRTGGPRSFAAGNTREREFFFTAKAQYENAGDLVINRLVLSELRSHGDVYVNKSGAPASYLGALGMTDDSSTRWSGRTFWFLRLLVSAARGHRPLLVFRPGGDRISGSVTTLDRAKAGLFSQLTRAGIVQVKYGASFHGRKSLDRGRIQHLDSLLVRDHDSLRECQGSSDGRIGVIGDMACLLPFDARLGDRNLHQPRELLTLCVRSIENGPEAWVGVGAFPKLATDLGLQTVVVSQVQLDEETSAWAARRLSAPFISWRGDLTTLLEVLDTYERSRFTVTSRLHAALLAALCGSCPIVVEPPQGKSRKVAACFEFLQLGDLVVGSLADAATLVRDLATNGIPDHVSTALAELAQGTVGARVSEAIAADLEQLQT